MNTTKQGQVKMSEKINREDEKLGQRLQFYREQAHLTQKDIADACGLSKNYISAIERGIHKCNAKTFIAYGKMCGISLDILADLSHGSDILIDLQDSISSMSIESQRKLLDWLKTLKNN